MSATATPRRGPARILIVIPTYDERDNVPRKVPLVLAQDPRIDILVVDDSSPDGTGEIAEEMAATEPRLNVLHRLGKEGIGKAYLAGFEWGLARDYDAIFEMDADISHPPDSLPGMIRALTDHDFVVGSRYAEGRVTVSNWPMSRLLISFFGSLYARTITGLPIRDATGGFNAWNRRVLESVELDRVRSNGYSFQIELKFRAWRRGFTWIEIPILFTERDSGESKLSKKIVREAIWRVWWLRLRQLTGRL